MAKVKLIEFKTLHTITNGFEVGTICVLAAGSVEFG